MKELLSDLIGPVTGIINKVVPDKDEAARLALEIIPMADRHAQGLAVDQIEDTSRHCAGCDCDGWRDRCLCCLAGAKKVIYCKVADASNFGNSSFTPNQSNFSPK